MKILFAVLFMVFFTTPTLCARVVPQNDGSISFNVLNYGANGDGQNDDSQAFEKAWQEVCSATEGTPTLVIPSGKSFTLQPMLFEGPCKSNSVRIHLEGTIVAPKSVNAWKWNKGDRYVWMKFRDIDGLIINGRGTFDGQGAVWWDKHSNRPTALQFISCKNFVLSGTTHINSPKNHISISSCSDSVVSNIHVIAPEESPNTDGIDISSSSNIIVQNSKFETGDDCVAINSGSTFINITGVHCGPGHGISVGSLGRDGDYNTVEEVHVRNCTFQRTMYGARIKTWMGGSGYARKITYEDIILIEAKNPVIIDQQYVSYRYGGGSSAVRVSDVTYRNVKGTSVSDEAITLSCDHRIGCSNIVLDDIDITHAEGGETQAYCLNAHGSASSCNPSVECLS